MTSDSIISKITLFLNTFRTENQEGIINKGTLNSLAKNQLKNPDEFNIKESKSSIRKWFRDSIQYKEPFIWIRSGDSEKFKMTDFQNFIKNDQEIVDLLGSDYTHYGITLSRKQNHFDIILILAKMNSEELINTTIIQTYINAIDRLRRISNCKKIEWSEYLYQLSMKQLKNNIKNNNLSAQNSVEKYISDFVKNFKTGYVQKEGDLEDVMKYCSHWSTDDQFRNDAIGDYDKFGINWIINENGFTIFYIFSKKLDKSKETKESQRKENTTENKPSKNTNEANTTPKPTMNENKSNPKPTMNENKSNPNQPSPRNPVSKISVKKMESTNRQEKPENLPSVSSRRKSIDGPSQTNPTKKIVVSSTKANENQKVDSPKQDNAAKKNEKPNEIQLSHQPLDTSHSQVIPLTNNVSQDFSVNKPISRSEETFIVNNESFYPYSYDDVFKILDQFNKMRIAKKFKPMTFSKEYSDIIQKTLEENYTSLQNMNSEWRKKVQDEISSKLLKECYKKNFSFITGSGHRNPLIDHAYKSLSDESECPEEKYSHIALGAAIKGTGHAIVILSIKMYTPNIKLITSRNEMTLLSLKLTNEFRASQGKPPLSLSFELCGIAQPHADWMLENSNMSHHGCEERFKQMSRNSMASENVAVNSYIDFPVEKVINQWINSPGHRANMLSNTSSYGFAYATDGIYFYAIQLFSQYFVPNKNIFTSRYELTLQALNLINDFREKNGKMLLKLDNDLCGIAQQQADYMLQKGDCDLSCINERYKQMKPFKSVRVVVGYHAGQENFVEAMVKGWIEEPNNRKSILSNSSSYGFAYYTDGYNFSGLQFFVEYM
ncbi:hypothetical protein TVAG_267560 [Trichomonas vaginalis G3]|uniref:SCP domain-containing protein n=1 Tax=Trichomonas vaginalis (strain ATCC PRA-98 / G3) TaxID=412133 RepID=A2DLA6_TRIV3|nr:hypothetical protein TVAG_267560 [Trichomonas vaginalis G3]|eukprot:XP_001579710.1 hypothetical protein [Trichomonas vaginalis G3]